MSFDQRLLAWSRGVIQASVLDVLAQRVLDCLAPSSSVRSLPSAPNVCSTYAWPSASPRSPSVQSTQRFQRGRCSFGARQHRAVELEVLVDERVGRQDSALACEQVPAQVGLPVVERRRRDDLRSTALKKSGWRR